MSFSGLFNFCTTNQRNLAQNDNNPIELTEENIPVRSLYISSLPNYLFPDAIREYFKSFGAIENVRLHRKPNYCYGFVLFKNAEDAACVLQSNNHRIMGRIIKVAAADSWHQPNVSNQFNSSHQNQENNNRPVVNDGKKERNILNQSAQTTILNLNDDCLLEVFGYLKVVDLCSVADICPRFKENANIVFISKYKEFNFFRISDQTNGHVTLLQARNLLRQFGCLITSLNISLILFRFKSTTGNRILDLIIKYCTGTLYELRLDNFAIKGGMLQKLQPIFTNLTKLTLDSCEINENIKSLFMCCTALKKLKLSVLHFRSGKCVQVSFPKLEAFSIENVDGLSNQSIGKFIERNHQLKKIKIVHCGDISDVVFEVIKTNLPLIENIRFNQHSYETSGYFNRNVMQLANLQLLKRLKLNCAKNSISSLVSTLATNNVPLELIELSNCPSNGELIDGIAELKEIKILKLCNTDGITDTHLKDLAKALNKLTDFEIKNCFTITIDGLMRLIRQNHNLRSLSLRLTNVKIDIESYNKLLEIVLNRANKCKLQVFLTGNSSSVDVPKEMIIEHENVLDININESDSYLSDDTDNADDMMDNDDDTDDDFFDNNMQFFYYNNSDDSDEDEQIEMNIFQFIMNLV